MNKIVLTLTITFLTTFSFGQNYTSYLTGDANDVIASPAGGVCLMGGATENDDAMKWFLNRANGGDILVLRASGSNGYNNYLYSQLGITVNSVETIVFNDATAAEENYIHQRINEAEAIWFAGGNQWNYVNYWRNTMIDSLINLGIQSRNIVIGGTSAGMAILGSIYFSAEFGTVSSPIALANPYQNAVHIDSMPFLDVDYLKYVITDTHYDNPDRKGRHMTFLARALTDWNIIAKGIACDEYTAVCIDSDGIAHIYGEYPSYDDNAYFLQVNCEQMPNVPENCTSGQSLNWNVNGQAVKVYAVKGTITGTNTFDLNTWDTGNGGSWEDWSVNNGIFSSVSGNPINLTNCIPVSTNKLENSSFVSVFPNPVKDGLLNLETDVLIHNIEIINIHGQILENIQNPKDKINIGHLSNGVYFLRFRTNKQHQLVKIVVV